MSTILNFFENKLVPIFGFFLLFLCLWSLLATDSIYVLGNIHDLWMPYISAEAAHQGLVQHSEFNTSFGFFYSSLNYFSLCIINIFPNIFTRSDLIALTSVQFALILSLLFLIIKLNSFTNKIPWLFLPIIISINFQLRDMSKPFNYEDVLWYGSYNAHLWSLLLIQIVSICDLYSFIAHERVNKIKKSRFIVFILIQVICAYIALNYKMNFFIASVGLASSILFYLNNKMKAFYLFLLIAIGFTLLLLTELLTKYSYFEYYLDVMQSVLSKKKSNHNYLRDALFFLFLLFPIIFYKKFKFKPLESNAVTFRSLKELIFSPFKDKGFFTPDSFFCLALCVSLLVGVVGDWQKPATYYFIVVCIFSIQIIKNKAALLISYSLVSFLFLINCISIIYISNPDLFHLNEDNKDNYGNSLYQSLKLFDEETSFVVKRFRGSRELLEFLEYETSSLDKILKISSLYKPGKQKWNLLFENVQYDALIREAVSSINDFGYIKSDKIMLLEFVNPLPIILKTNIQKGSFHWIHLGTTFSVHNINKLNVLFEKLDIVYVPSSTTDGFSQTFLNCSFFEWNAKNQVFKPYKVGPAGTLFVSNAKAEQTLRQPLSYDKSILKNNCKDSIRLANRMWE